jgi:hypothetical protein
MVLNVSGGIGKVGAAGVDKHCFWLIQTVQEELQGTPACCSFNNSRVAEVHVCGSYAREHIFLSFSISLMFLYSIAVFLLTLPLAAWGRMAFDPVYVWDVVRALSGSPHRVRRDDHRI